MKTWSSMAGQRLPFFRGHLVRSTGVPSHPGVAGAPGHRLRPSGRRVGGPVLHPARHRRGPRRRGHRHRARRPRHRRPPPGGVPRRHGGPDHGDDRGHRLVHLRRALPARQRLLVGARGGRDARPAPTTATRSGGGRRGTTGSGSPSWRRCSRSSPGSVLNLDIKQTAPVVTPYEEALADLLRRFDGADRVIVASFLDTATERLLGLRPRVLDLGRHRGHRRLLPGRPGRRAAPGDAPRRAPGTGQLRRGHPGGRPLRRGGPRGGPGRARVDHRGGVRDGAAVRPGCGRDHHRPAHGPGRSARPISGAPGCPGERLGAGTTVRSVHAGATARPRRDRPGARTWTAPTGHPGRDEGRSGCARSRGATVSRARSSASCRGWPSSWPGACACWFVSTQFVKASRSPTRAANGVPGRHRRVSGAPRAGATPR